MFNISRIYETSFKKPKYVRKKCPSFQISQKYVELKETPGMYRCQDRLADSVHINSWCPYSSSTMTLVSREVPVLMMRMFPLDLMMIKNKIVF